MKFDANELEKLFDRLWPICRSITGKGYSESLDILSERVPFERYGFATGESVFDWKIPKEWNVADAYIIDPNGKKRAHFKANNLHLLGYSIPFSGTLPLSELKSHLYSLPEIPNAIPYMTSYYKARWGFCMTHEELESLPDGNYDVVVDTTLEPGYLYVAEAILPGQKEEEIFISSYLCHPSLANNELSGPIALAFLYQQLAAMPNRKYTYRFAIVPETIGAIAYLTIRGEHLKKKMIAGYQITCVGDPGDFSYKMSRQGSSLSDRAAKIFLKHRKHKLYGFDPSDGSDERQYSSPGFDLPIGSLMRTIYGEFFQYHNSLDNKEFISFSALKESIDAYFSIINIIEMNDNYINNFPNGEPRLGERGLYPDISQLVLNDFIKTMMWILNFSDGKNDLITIAEKANLDIETVLKVAKTLIEKGLLKVGKT